MQEPIRLTRREMLKCILATPLGAALTGLPAERAESQIDEVSPPDYEILLLWEGRAMIDNSGRDIKGNNAQAFATISHAANYSQLIWMGYKMSNASLEYRVMARSVDSSGLPLGAGWFPIAQGTITTPAQRWFRLLINDAHWDEYRIEVRSVSPQLVHSRVLARWDYLPK
ncbi:MAG: hypothetical protein NZM10_07745 [Fimbriimonadales bacterium]|nr:hypothetical protein [Fimbriimonadales bacterium]